jgi:hypothetical protein
VKALAVNWTPWSVLKMMGVAPDYKGPGFNASPNYKAIFYEDVNYQGRKLVLPPGYYPSIHEIPYNFGDVISSVGFSPAAQTTPPDYGAIPIVIEAFRDLDFQGQKSGVFTWPHQVDVDALVTDDHWVTDDPAYTRLAVRSDNEDAVGVQLRWMDIM